jgi:hypothetical protein
MPPYAVDFILALGVVNYFFPDDLDLLLSVLVQVLHLVGESVNSQSELRYML